MSTQTVQTCEQCGWLVDACHCVGGVATVPEVEPSFITDMRMRGDDAASQMFPQGVNVHVVSGAVFGRGAGVPAEVLDVLVAARWCGTVVGVRDGLRTVRFLGGVEWEFLIMYLRLDRRTAVNASQMRDVAISVRKQELWVGNLKRSPRLLARWANTTDLVEYLSIRGFVCVP